ncbi:prepilin-type N-terminal cleavage/methylation domain-containing protein [Moritella marina ATCC 15381]|uniref:Prepilin-type N-terminal cleavage/methylation domain-containing protein n=1 Tax=Moritella marina ATCC 15381 TaxID=1202962 RepID=A0A5J6WG05_MORMI|nr:type IV pilin protein [Moritella marina]QFI36907.1 prepilin-type N-terminal cleavage/methylation domain-containing protein [Moritella marina ATCC 15381]
MQKQLISSGFTLIELLTTLAIMSILIGVRLPNYQQTLLSTYRDQAKIKLTTISLLQTDHYSRHQQYVELNHLAIDLSSNKYQYSLQLNESNGYKVAATARDNQRHDSECQELSLDHNLTRLPAACW